MPTPVRDNHFVLKPYLTLWLPDQIASIKGTIMPLEAEAVVFAVANGDTLVAIPDDDDGRFKIRGLKGKTADIFIMQPAMVIGMR